MTRTAREVVELYNFVVWNQRDYAMAHELLGESVIRHEVAGSHTLTRDQAVQRIRDVWALFDDVHFELPVLVAGDDGEHIAIVYDTTMTAADGTVVEVGSTEIFRVVDGRIIEVWNCGGGQGRWV